MPEWARPDGDGCGTVVTAVDAPYGVVAVLTGSVKVVEDGIVGA
ncbi:hypothetical protein [Streptomyces sp. MRC013]|nr:hypothetical protein [Streptomyces sp. MRC013]